MFWFKFFFTLNLAETYIADKDSYNFVVVKSESVLLDVHADCIYYSGCNNLERVKKVEATDFCRRMANFACLVNDPFAFMLFYTPLKVANPAPATREFIVKYIWYHRFVNLGQELTYNGRICTNANIPIKCVGTWKSYKCAEGFCRM